MENRGLLFIPDISGFTRFVNETEISHSRLIIQELLELLINANEIGLEVSEIEGDAILFYKFGEPPELAQIYRQVEHMFIAFHEQLVAYEYRRFCQCQACMSAIQLTLKVVTHYGEFTDYNVKNFQKLIGRDVIVAHQLLKNNISEHEYWLVTEGLSTNELPQLSAGMIWNSSAKETETGLIPFRYTQLGQLKRQIKPQQLPRLKLEGKRKVLSFSDTYGTTIIPLFHATGDFSYRSRWQFGVKAVEELTHFLPRIGMRCRFIMDDDEASVYASSYSFSPQRIEFSETSEKTGNTIYYTLEAVDDTLTKLSVDLYIRKNIFSAIRYHLKEKQSMQHCWQTSLNRLHTLVKEIRLPA